jgi:small subunit ribosomal protein S8
MVRDLLNDALVALRHADRDGRPRADLSPTSKLVGEVLRLFRAHGYLEEFAFVPTGRGGRYEVSLARRINSCGVIKPRLSVRYDQLERYESRFLPAQDFGLLVLSTNRGVIGQAEARELKIGGRLLAYVY